MEILESFYRRKLKKKQKRSTMFHSEIDLNRASSLGSVGTAATGGDGAVSGGSTVATGLINRVLHLTRRREPRPHSWHSTKLGDGSSESVEAVGRMSSGNNSAADLLLDLDSRAGVRWSLESLEPAQSSTRPAAALLGPRSSSSCMQLSSTRSSSTELRQSKRETAYSSYSSPGFPECHGLSGERSFSLETVPQTEDLRTQSLSLEQESRARVRLRVQAVGGACYHSSREDGHNLGRVWGSSCESLKGAPAPQRSSDSYTTRRPERPSSWSSLEHTRPQRSLRSQQRGSWHHSSTSLASAGPAKGLYMADGQLHTVIEKSPETSPASRPRQVQSPGAPQEPSCPALYPSWPRDYKNGHHHRVVPHSFLGSQLCHSPANTQIPPIPQDSTPVSPVPLSHQSQSEHPLTRLEMALAEVQGTGSILRETSPTPGVSVLEKVSRFEHREWATRQHGLSSRHRSSPKVSDKSQKTLCGEEDLRKMPERSISGTKACRALSHTGISHEKNRSNRDGVKDTQPKVIRSTSFKCTSSDTLPPPPLPPKLLSYQDKGDMKQLPSSEKKGPKTLPKPLSVVLAPRTFSHTVSFPAPPGPAPLTRICGRKRLTSEQKKRSFSEPECMNEIGLTHPDSTTFLRHAGDPSVADRRRMFELAAQGVVVQETVVGHVQNNFNQKREGRSQRGTQRPLSAVFQPPHTHADSVKLASSSSMLSLTDCAQGPHLFSGEGPLSSAMAPGEHLRSTHSRVSYPGRVTSPRAPAFQPPSHNSSVSLGEDGHQSISVSQSMSLPQELDSPQLERTDCTSLSTPAGDAVEQGEHLLSGHTRKEDSVPESANRTSHETPAPDSPAPHSSQPATLSTSVPRRERPRRSSRSNLAASVGLPCPLSHTSSPELKPSESRDEHSEYGESEPSQQRKEPARHTRDKGQSFHRADREDSRSPSTHSVKTQLDSSRGQVQEDSLVLEYEPVPVRLQSPEECRVQALVRTLVRSDRTLTPLMALWGKSTIDVLKDIFPNSRLLENLSRHHSHPLDDWEPDPAINISELSVDLITRKVELCEALLKCAESLQREKEALSDAFRAHTELGNRVDAWIQERCEDSEKDKYHMFIGDLERVVNLLLSLCGRLARIERSLASLHKQELTEGSTELQDSLVHKRTLLLRQTQDALELRDHLERRQCTVHAFLRRSLAPGQLQQYRRLVRSTPALLIGLRRLDDLLQWAQETLSLLLDTVPLEVTQARGWSRVGLALTTTPLPLMRTQAPPTWHSGPAPLDCPVTVTSL